MIDASHPGWRRLRAIAGYTGRSLLPMALGLLTSLLVVRRDGAALWGSFVAVQLALQLAAHVVGWGNKDQVLRALARDGHAAAAAVLGNLRARFLGLFGPVVLVVVAFAVAVGWSPTLTMLGAAWIALRVLVQSFDALVLHERRFVRAALSDTAGALVVVAGLLALPFVALDVAPTVTLLLALFCGAEALRLAALTIVFPELWARPATESFTGSTTQTSSLVQSIPAVLREGLPFFLLGAAGMLGSRVDLYCVTALLPTPEVARYQVLISALLWLQSIAALVLNPFARELYGMGHGALLRLTLAFAGFGALIALPGVAGLWWLLVPGYGMAVDLPTMTVGYLYVVQMFVQVPAIYALYKAGRERGVLATSVAILVANFALNLALIPLLGALGALVASAVVGWAAAVSYLWRAAALARTPVDGA